MDLREALGHFTAGEGLEIEFEESLLNQMVVGHGMCSSAARAKREVALLARQASIEDSQSQYESSSSHSVEHLLEGAVCAAA